MAQSRPTTPKRTARATQATRSGKPKRSASPRNHAVPLTAWQRIRLALTRRIARINARRVSFLARRPHRSFRRTRRRDYHRSLALPGYHSFTLTVLGELKRRWRTFVLLAVSYATLIVILGGVTNQETYTQISELLQESSATLASGGWDTLGQAGLLMVATFASGPSDLSADQQVYLGIILLFTWLSTVWLLREYKLGRKPRLRDALYNSGAPFLSTLLVLVVLVCQLLPIGIVALVYAGLSSVGIVGEGFGSMIFWVFAAIVAALVLYWVTSTIIALVVVTLPGMYPMRAIKAAGDLVVGRRLRITYRLLWVLGTVALGWLAVMVPLVLLTSWLGSFWAWMANIPVMPVAAAMMSAGTIVWVSSYVYLLYRKVVDDGTAPA